jgi:hypothetical protein
MLLHFLRVRNNPRPCVRLEWNDLINPGSGTGFICVVVVSCLDAASAKRRKTPDEIAFSLFYATITTQPRRRNRLPTNNTRHQMSNKFCDDKQKSGRALIRRIGSGSSTVSATARPGVSSRPTCF